MQIPLQQVENQTIFTAVGGQNIQLDVYQKSGGLFVNVWFVGSTAPIVAGRLGQSGRLIVISPYLGFIGDFTFYDTTGQQANPIWDGLSSGTNGGRYMLVYLSPTDIASTLAVAQGES